MIEGDNRSAEAAAKSYASKVKLIYIDPPYNTGKGLCIPDNFRTTSKLSGVDGQVEGGQRIAAIPKPAGSFH